MNIDVQRLPDSVEELQRMIRQLTTDHDSQLGALEARLRDERNERIEQQNKALEYFEELQLLRR
jgi:LPS O-antigen subunit length determinant protein (WzzB/FepE family)